MSDVRAGQDMNEVNETQPQTRLTIALAKIPARRPCRTVVLKPRDLTR